jgi:hypothetical protein
MYEEEKGDGDTYSLLYSSRQMMHESGRNRSMNSSLVGILDEAPVEG